MLVLTRKPGQSIVITCQCGCQTVVKVIEYRDRRGIRIGIDANPETTIHREEIQDRIDGV